MKKRICSFIMVLAMILTMLPTKVQAANEPDLIFHFIGYDQSTDTYFDSNVGGGGYTAEIGRSEGIILYYRDAVGNLTFVPYSEVKSSNEAVVTIEEDSRYEGAALLKFVGIGTTTIDYIDANNNICSIDIETVLPQVGYYTTQTASKDTLITSFDVTNENNTFYLVAREDVNLTSVTANWDTDQIADITWDISKQYAIVEVTGIPLERSYTIQWTGIRDNDALSGWSSIALSNQKTALCYALATWNDDVPSPIDSYETALSMGIDEFRQVYVYFSDNGVQQVVPVESLSSSNDRVIQCVVDPNYPELIRISAVGGEQATIDFTHNGTVYSIDVNVELPTVAFYSASTGAPESYIKEFAITDDDTANTIYLVAHDAVFENVQLDGYLQQVATMQISEDRTCATVTIADAPYDGHYSVSGQVTKDDGTTTDFYTNVFIQNKKTKLVYRYGRMSNNTMAPSDRMYKSLSVVLGGSATIYPYLVKGEVETLVPVEALKASNTDIVKISAHPIHEGVALVQPVGIGNTTIYYEKDGKRCELNVTTKLPEVGFYTTASVSPNSLIKEFTVTKNGPNVFYLVAQGGTLSNLQTPNGLGDIADIVLSEDGTYAKITVTGIPSNTNYMIQGTYSSENIGTYPFSSTIALKDAKSALMFDITKHNGDGTVSPYGSPYTNMSLTKGYMNETFVVFGADADYVTLSADQLKSSNENIVKISNSTRYSNTVVIEAVGCGTATISYTNDKGKVYSCEVQVNLPGVGYYTTPSASESSYITKFIVTDEGPNVFYLVGDGYTIDNLVLNGGLSEIATATLSEDKTYATITVHGIPDAHSYSINYVSTNTYGNTFSGGASIQLVNGMASLQYEYVIWDEEDVPGPSGYPQSRMNIANGSISSIYTYFVKNGQKEPVVAGNLKSSNENIVKVFADEEYADIVNVEICGFGNAAITYTDSNGETYELPVTAILPAVGFYTTTTATESSYITEFAVTDEGPNVIYLATNSCEIDNVILDDELSNIAMVTLGEGYATVEITGTPMDKEYELRVVLKDRMSSWAQALSIQLKNEKTQPTPSPTPSATPSPAPSATPSPAPSASPSPAPSATPSPAPSASPSPTPSASPSPTPSATSSPAPSANPSPAPSATPSPAPSATPSPTPTPSAKPEDDVKVEVDEDLPTVDTSKPVEDVTVGVDKEASNTVLEETVKEIISAIVNNPEEIKDKVSEEVVQAIQSAVESGAELQVTTSIKVENLNEESIEDNEEIKADVEAIEKAIENGIETEVEGGIEGGKVAQVLDIKITVTAKVNNEEAASSNVSVLDEPVVFTVAIPEEMKVVPEGFERQMYIIYVHEGVVKSIPVTQNEDGTISFPAHEFSTYALVYKDVPKAQPSPTPSPEPTPTPEPEQETEESAPSEEVVVPTPTPAPVVPETGDASQISLYIVLSMLCILVLGILGTKRKLQ